MQPEPIEPSLEFRNSRKRRLRAIYTPGRQIQDFVDEAFKRADPKVLADARKMIFGK